MKRLVFCFDGTWNTLNETTPTNVVLTAASIQRTTAAGITQIIHYDEGVGTGRLEHWTGGMFGAGLIERVRAAYRFLIFNYDPGDELYVLGFSRGAFSARTFVGFLRHVGPLRRLHAGLIDQALALYTQRLRPGNAEAARRFRADYAGGVCIGADDDAWRCANVPGYAAGSAPVMTIHYLGAWDTVGALGVPAILPGSARINRRYAFHDVRIDGFIESARHAIAIDEDRVLFPSTPFGDLDALNAAAGHAPDAADAPYQERWFPGIHGSVGGGGDIRGLSDATLAWIIEGAKAAGLRLDTAAGTRISGFRPDPYVPVVNLHTVPPSPVDLLRKPRTGPARTGQLSASALRRWQAAPDRLPGGKPYRPRSLAQLEPALGRLPPWSFDPPTDLIATVTVAFGDTLSGIARAHYGSAAQWPAIFAANRDTLDDPDEIFPGQQLRLPRLPPDPPASP